MNKTTSILSLVAAGLFTLASCADSTPPSPASPSTNKNSCYIMYDAGSSGTRLYIYEQNGSELLEHEGPKVAALADPVRSNRDKTPDDIDAVTSEVANALELIKTDGPLDDGKPKWKGFDWSQECKVISAKVLATAGMRIAEQEKPAESLLLWQTLKPKLVAKVGPNVIVENRTLTGYEEGLFAWLSVKGDSAVTDFGIVEMGGASSQIAFPCDTCDPLNDSVRMVHLGGQTLPVYSYSYLGLGQDEAPKSLPKPYTDPTPPDCAHGVGATQAGWEEEDCADDIPLTIESTSNIRDPYNYTEGGTKGTSNTLPAGQALISKWSLTGAFNYTKDSDINDCCLSKGEGCFQPATACFRPIYLKKYLNTLKVPLDSTKQNSSWTRGAVICETEDCLANQTKDPVCRWNTTTDCLAQ